MHIMLLFLSFSSFAHRKRIDAGAIKIKMKVLTFESENLETGTSANLGHIRWGFLTLALRYYILCCPKKRRRLVD